MMIVHAYRAQVTCLALCRTFMAITAFNPPVSQICIVIFSPRFTIRKVEHQRG